MSKNLRTFSYMGFEDKNSVENLLPEDIKDLLLRKAVLNQAIEDEEVLRKRVKPSIVLNRLRLGFWKEYDYAQFKGKKMCLENIYRGVCSEEEFLNILETTRYGAWLLKPPTDYISNLEEALCTGINRLREMLEIPLYEERHVKVGRDEYVKQKVFDKGAAEILLKVVNMVDSRVNGAVVQRSISEVRNKTTIRKEVNVQGNNEEINIEKQIKEMERAILEGGKRSKDLEVKPFSKKDIKEIEARGVKVSDILDGEL